MQAQKVEELADLSRPGERIGHGKVGLDRVVVAAAVALARDVAGGGEVAEDAMGGALGDPDRLADLARMPGSWAMHSRTWAWLVRNDHVGVPFRATTLDLGFLDSIVICPFGRDTEAKGAPDAPL